MHDAMEYAEKEVSDIPVTQHKLAREIYGNEYTVASYIGPYCVPRDSCGSFSMFDIPKNPQGFQGGSFTVSVDGSPVCESPAKGTSLVHACSFGNCPSGCSGTKVSLKLLDLPMDENRFFAWSLRYPSSFRRLQWVDSYDGQEQVNEGPFCMPKGSCGILTLYNAFPLSNTGPEAILFVDDEKFVSVSVNETK